MSWRIPYLIICSIWANAASHFAAWIAGRVEEKLHEQKHSQA